MKSTKKAFLRSVLALVLCVSMFVGTTFAWFTDSVTSMNNIIQSGTLDIELQWFDEAAGAWKDVDQSTNVFDEGALWEPGYTEVVYLRVINAGNLALKYQLGVRVASQTEGTNVYGDKFLLSDYIHMGVATENIGENSFYADRDAARAAITTSNTLTSGKTVNGEMLKGDADEYFALVVYMPESVGNEANYKVGTTQPTINLGITLLATQMTAESDSFGPDYDTNATFPVLKPGSVTVNVTPNVNNQLTEDVTMVNEEGTISAIVPAGTLLNPGTKALTFSVSELSATQSNVVLKENEVMRSMDVHIEGVAAGNTTPIQVTIKEAAMPGLNIGNYALYHVENGATNEMTDGALTAHNGFAYDPATGDIKLSMATFSEIAVVNDTENAWEGNVAEAFAGGDGTEENPYLIANADQLAYLNKCVSDGTAQAGKFYKLLSDITFAGKTEDKSKVWYPIGYRKQGEGTNKAGENTWYTYGGAFQGVFDGAGHKISNIYQNTWIMDGNYDNGYWKEAMGLFGYVYGGTVKNLTIDNFYSEGEFTPTGCVAAYAANATFENIAVIHSHPQTYNTSVAAVVGRDGKNGENNNKEYNLIFRNITVDDTNTVSALWGSWDVGAAGLLGYLGSESKVLFENCNVAATIDVYNDVCGNYQYYWYRYCGAYIGTVDKRLDNGKGALDLSNVTATNCTVNFGDRHEYYYCEFEKNTVASYTDDFQFSRVDHSELNMDAKPVTCKHTHTANEDKQAVYIPFRQLFGGYGWGVDGVDLDEYNDIKISDYTNAQEKFETKFIGDFLYRVGNQNAVSLGTLFAQRKDLNVEKLPILSSGVYVTVDKVDENMNVSGTFTANTSDWTKGTIQFSGTGVVKVTIQDYNFCKPTELYLEVVDAKNITSATGTTTGGNLVLLCDVNSSSYVNYWNCTLYGNGFTYTLKGAPTAYNSKQGHGILITQNATLDNLVIIGDVYEEYGAYQKNACYNAAIDAQESTRIQNCFIANCAAPVKTRGDVTIVDTTLYGGAVANLIIMSGVVTLESVTTANYEDGRSLVGMGIVVHSDAADGAKLVLNGKLMQYNFVSEAKIPDDVNAKGLYDVMFGTTCSKFQFGTSPNRYVNTGIISLTTNFDESDIIDNAQTGYEGLWVDATGYDGYVYTQPNTTGTVNNGYDQGSDLHKSRVQGDYLPTPEFSLGNQAVTGEDHYLKGDINGVEARYIKGETPFDLDITKLMKVFKYTELYYDVTASCKDANGNAIALNNGKITLDDAGEYVLVFTVQDNEFYNPNGTKTDKSVPRTYEVPLTVIVAEPAIKDAVIVVNKTALDGGYNESLGDRSYKFNPLNAITITDAEGTVNLTTNIASTNIVYASSSSAFAGVTTITVTYNDGRVLEIKLGKPSLNSPGSSKAITYSNDGTIKSAAKVASKSATGGTWTVTSYSFKGTNGKTVTNNTVVTFNFPDKSCVTGDTLVMLADGTQKRIDEVTYNDQLLVWNFFTGEYDVVPSAIIFFHGDDLYRVLKLHFEDGTTVKVINNHGFFDMERNEFMFITEDNVKDYIGHSFAKVNGKNRKAVKLVSYSITEEYTGCYSIQSAVHNNFMTEGMFSLTIPHYDGWFDYFEIGEGMKYDEEKMQADIEKYGLYDYSEFADYVTYEQFVAFNGPYLKVLVGRGVVTLDQIFELIATYVNP